MKNYCTLKKTLTSFEEASFTKLGGTKSPRCIRMFCLIRNHRSTSSLQTYPDTVESKGADTEKETFTKMKLKLR